MDDPNDIPDQTPCGRLACNAPKWKHPEVGHEFEERK